MIDQTQAKAIETAVTEAEEKYYLAYTEDMAK